MAVPLVFRGEWHLLSAASQYRAIVADEATNDVLAVDIGGTKLAAGIVSPTGVLLDRAQVATGNPSDDRELFDSLTELLQQFAPFGRFSVCGVGCGGPMSGGGVLVSPLNIPAWRSFPLAEELSRFTGLGTRVDNDAKALALAEGWVGAAVGVRDFLAMVVSTGVGGGIVLDGRLLDGNTGNAGHIGHVVVRPDGHVLPGHVAGVLEGEASGTAIEHRTGTPSAGASTAEIERAGRLVGRAIGSTANLLDLQLAVIAGSVALGFGEPFFTAVQAEVDAVCRLDHSRGTLVRPAGCGDEGPLIGAAAVGLRHLGQRIGVIE